MFDYLAKRSSERRTLFLDIQPSIWYIIIVSRVCERGMNDMSHIQTLPTRDLCESAKKGGCGECQTSCQSACKTSCGIANQKCENQKTDK